MRPRVVRPDGGEIAPAVTVLLAEKAPAATIDQLRHIVRRTHDARQRYQDGLRFLASTFYGDPERFSDVLTGLFAADSTVAAALIAEGRCVLHFREAATGYQVPCAIVELAEGDAPAQLTCWHNRLFGPDPPTGIRLLAFRPDWERATAQNFL
jgi:hypothetical protein